MNKFLIQGGKPLSGEVTISGSKNSAAAIIPASVLTTEDCFLGNVPKISDIMSLLDLLAKMGAKVEWTKNDQLKINTKNLDPDKIDFKVMERIRMSIVLTGAILARFGKITFSKPGGCAIGSRPIVTHLRALVNLGAQCKFQKGRFALTAPKGLFGAKIVLDELSVTATENTLFAAGLARGETIIKLAAVEPHVVELSSVLKQMGLRITGEGTHELIVKKVKKLRGFRHTLISDPIETGTFIVAAVVTAGDVLIKKAVPENLEIELLKLEQAGVNFKARKDSIHLKPTRRLRALEKIQSLPFPGFSSDLLAPFALLMTQACGMTLIHETLYEGRIRNYIPELQKMGANALICDPHRAVITGKTKLKGQRMMSFDLRAGATLILAALAAEGESLIENIAQVDRGYEEIEKKLQKLGAAIKRI